MGFNFNNKRLGNYYALACGHLDDVFKKPNYKMAAKYFNLSVENEDEDTACLSAAKLARLYQRGYGVPQNNKKAAVLYELASKKPHMGPEDENNLGVYYYSGIAIKKDREKAKQLFESARGYSLNVVNPCAVVNCFMFDANNLLLSPNDSKEAILKITKGAGWG